MIGSKWTHTAPLELCIMRFAVLCYTRAWLFHRKEHYPWAIVRFCYLSPRSSIAPHDMVVAKPMTLLEQIQFVLTVVFGISRPLYVKFQQSMGFLMPATDVMSAILALYMEVFTYGVFILLLVTYVLDVCITEYSAEVVVPIRRTTPLHLDDPVDIHATKYVYHIDERDEWEFEDSGWSGFYPSYFTKRAESFLDVCFSVFPTGVVVCLLVPTLGFLYTYDQLPKESLFMGIDVIGHQWYWSYEYCIGTGDNDWSFDSLLEVDTVVNRNLEVDSSVVIPTGARVGFSFTSSDVIHSWAVPQLGIKVDAVPGRISNATVCTFTDGVFYGQCSELCGVMHGFMPICIESVPLRCFFMWAIHCFVGTTKALAVPFETC